MVMQAIPGSALEVQRLQQATAVDLLDLACTHI